LCLSHLQNAEATFRRKGYVRKKEKAQIAAGGGVVAAQSTLVQTSHPGPDHLGMMMMISSGVMPCAFICIKNRMTSHVIVTT